MMKPLIIGLTGGIGSGKTTVANIFRELGIQVFDSDSVAKQAYLEQTIAHQIKLICGNEVYLSDDLIDKKLLSDIIFKDESIRKKINKIIHPFVSERFNSWCFQHSSSKVLIKETALLFESRINEKVDIKLLVVSPMELRIKRVMERDRITREEVIKKISSQMSDEEKIPLSNVTIINDEKSLILPQVINFLHNLPNQNYL